MIGPTFQFDPTHINFGTVSYGQHQMHKCMNMHLYTCCIAFEETSSLLLTTTNSETNSHTTGFLSSREIVLTNTSDIPMTYHLRVSSDEAEAPTEGEQVEEGTEFDMEPKRGVLPANYHQSIRVHYMFLLYYPCL